MINHANELSVATPAFIDALTGGSRRTPATSASQPPPQPIEVTPRLLRLLQACLDRLDPDLIYPTWYRIAAVLFHETDGSAEGYSLFDEWSRAGRKYKGEKETRTVWNSFDPDYPTPPTLATLRYLLAAEGVDWYEVCDAAEEQFQAVDNEGGQ